VKTKVLTDAERIERAQRRLLSAIRHTSRLARGHMPWLEEQREAMSAAYDGLTQALLEEREKEREKQRRKAQREQQAQEASP
jgi:hypothetical protein